MCMKGPPHIYIPAYLRKGSETEATTIQPLNSNFEQPANDADGAAGADGLQDIEKLHIQQYYENADAVTSYNEKEFLLPPPATAATAATASSANRRKKGYLMVLAYIYFLVVYVMILQKNVTPAGERSSGLDGKPWSMTENHNMPPASRPNKELHNESDDHSRGMMFKKMPCHKKNRQ